MKHIESCWDIRDFLDLPYVQRYHKADPGIEVYSAAGHDPARMTLWTHFDPEPMPPGVDQIRDLFLAFLSDVVIAVNLFRPGTYLPVHRDPYQRYREMFDASQTTIARYIVMLEHSQPGQIMQIQDQCYATWQAGDVFSWQDQDDHAFYNFSLKDRYALQVTGLIRDARL